VALAACGNPAEVVKFSGCKSGHSALTAQALTSAEASSLQGLQCLRWERQGARVRFEGFNISAGCSVAWQGEAVRSKDGKLDFVMSDPDCANLRCGSCLYDLSFEIDTDSTELQADASVGLTLHQCIGEDRSVGSWQLQPGATSAMHCKYAPGFAPGNCGASNMPCRNHCQAATAVMGGEACDPGLSCRSVAANLFVCLPQCERDEDCALAEVTSCIDGACQLIDTRIEQKH
jgi:hypothetical protein